LHGASWLLWAQYRPVFGCLQAGFVVKCPGGGFCCLSQVCSLVYRGFLIFTKSRKSTFEYKIIITSNKPNKEEIVVWDQIPFSTDEQIKIELLKPEYKKDMPALKMNEHKYLEWYFEMESGEKIQIPLKFSVEYPKDQIIHGL
jgi:hypothetical protein